MIEMRTDQEFFFDGKAEKPYNYYEWLLKQRRPCKICSRDGQVVNMRIFNPIGASTEMPETVNGFTYYEWPKYCCLNFRLGAPDDRCGYSEAL